jgi:hypothetical protein
MVESHQQIKDRLLKNASLIWGLKGTQTENSFDPLVGILLGACATELEKISNDIEDSRGRTLERMVQLLYPEVLCHALPAHCIVQTLPTEKFITLQSDAQFYYQKRFAPTAEGTAASWKNIYFSATGNFDLHLASVVNMATTKQLFKVNNGLQKEVLCTATSSSQNLTHQNSIWIGIDKIENLTNNTSFYFELKNEASQQQFYDYLPRAKWFCNNTEIITEQHYGKNINIVHTPNPQEIITGQTNTTNKILKHVNKFYANRFITATNLQQNTFENGWPVPLVNVFGEQQLSQLKNASLSWIRIDFPENIHIQKLVEDMCIGINCVPVVNRHLNVSQHKLFENINIIPLTSEELFLDILEITDLENHALNYAHGGDSHININLHFGGVERFNEKNAVATVQALIQQLRDESAAFANIGNDFLSMELKQMLQSLNKLEQQVQEKGLLKGETPYLVLSNKEDQELNNIYVKYWTTNGEDANGIKSGTQLSLHKNADVQSNATVLLSNTVGGRNNLNDKEKVLAYKTALLSKEKLVTHEDIAVFCKLRLALNNVKITIEKGYATHANAKGGFIKTIDVNIQVTEAEMKLLDERGGIHFWQQDLTQAITNNSNLFMPLQVFIKKSK